MKYERLARSGRSLGRWHTLWLGEDHLLAVVSTGYSEEYTRYYLKEIQAIVSRRSAWGKVLNAVSGSLLAICLLAGIVGYGNGLTPASVTAGIFGGFFLLLLLWNLLCGPTCCCQVRTQVSIDELPALNRTRSVRKVLARLRPLIGRLQGEITREEISELTGKVTDAPPAASPAATGMKVADSAPPLAENTISPYRGGFHLAAFSLLIADGTVSLFQILHSPKFLGYISAGLNLFFLIFAIIALIKQTKHPLPSLAKWMIWGGIATIATGIIIGFMFVGFISFEDFQHGIKTKNFAFDTAALAASHPVFAFYLLFYALLEAGIGIAGMIFLFRKMNIAGRDRT